LAHASASYFNLFLSAGFDRPRRQIATLFGVLPVFRHDPHSVEILDIRRTQARGLIDLIRAVS
jgi:hypothetical protein